MEFVQRRLPTLLPLNGADGHVGVTHNRSQLVQRADDPLVPEMDSAPDMGMVEGIGVSLGVGIPELLERLLVG
ncbi:hypothetical protein [Streptomyces angustmyceticus]|uniref:hypothetical protein n=1 Tax=Streptomyces angustmyceticus TaxID=285578 RepID=UPI003D8AE541